MKRANAVVVRLWVCMVLSLWVSSQLVWVAEACATQDDKPDASTRTVKYQSRSNRSDRVDVSIEEIDWQSLRVLRQRREIWRNGKLRTYYVHNGSDEFAFTPSRRTSSKMSGSDVIASKARDALALARRSDSEFSHIQDLGTRRIDDRLMKAIRGISNRIKAYVARSTVFLDPEMGLPLQLHIEKFPSNVSRDLLPEIEFKHSRYTFEWDLDVEADVFSIEPPDGWSTEPARSSAAQDDRLSDMFCSEAQFADRVGVAREFLSSKAQFGFSGSVLIARNDQVLLNEGYGLAAPNSECTGTTIYDVGSVAKQFTAAAILKLQSEGKLNVNDPIANYWNVTQKDVGDITIHELLTHTSGLHTAVSDVNFQDRDETIGRLFELGQTGHERTFAYNNMGYVVLAGIIEKASGASFEDYLDEHLFDQVGLSDTSFCGDSSLPDDQVATGKKSTDTWFLKGHTRPLTWGLRGCTCILTTTEDLYRWITALRHGVVIDEQLRDMFFANHVDSPRGGYGYGWWIDETDGVRKLGHSGTTIGYSCDVQTYDISGHDDPVTIVVLSNNQSERVRKITGQIEQILSGENIEMPPKSTAVSEADLTAWRGRYRLDDDEYFEIDTQANQLVLRPVGQQTVRLVEEGRWYSPCEHSDVLLGVVHRLTTGDPLPLSALVSGWNLEWSTKWFNQHWSKTIQLLGEHQSNDFLGTIFPRWGAKHDYVVAHYEQGDVFVRFVNNRFDQTVWVDVLTDCPIQKEFKLTSIERAHAPGNRTADLFLQKDTNGNVTGIIYKTKHAEKYAQRVK